MFMPVTLTQVFQAAMQAGTIRSVQTVEISDEDMERFGIPLSLRPDDAQALVGFEMAHPLNRSPQYFRCFAPACMCGKCEPIEPFHACLN